MVGKNYFEFAPESDYGVAPSSGWKGIRVSDDGHKANVLTLAPGGIVRGQQGPQVDGRRAVPRDATGTVKTYLMSNGLGAWLRAGFGNAVLSTPAGATDARKMVFTTTSAASAFSLATILGREMKSGSVDHDTHVGGQIVETRFMQSLAPESGGVDEGSLAKVEFDLAYQKLDRAFAAHSSTTYVVPDLYYSIGECTLSVGPDLEDLDDECLNKFELKIPQGLDTNDQCINASLIKDKAVRGSLPAPTLGLAWTYKSRTYYDAYLDGTIMAFRAKWENPNIEIEDGFSPSVTIDIPAFQLSGDTPQMAEGAKTTQDLPAEVLHNGTDPMITVTVITSDTAF